MVFMLSVNIDLNKDVCMMIQQIFCKSWRSTFQLSVTTEAVMRQMILSATPGEGGVIVNFYLLSSNLQNGNKNRDFLINRKIFNKLTCLFTIR